MRNLKLSSDVEAEVRGLIQNVSRDWAGHPMGVAEIASRLGLLPLLLDMGGFIALKGDGTLISIVWDDPNTERPITSARERDIALSVGSERYPVFKQLLPKRKPDAGACPV
jgi:hypothetical protein